MLGQIKLITNLEEIDKAEKLGCECKKKYAFGEFVFRLQDIDMAFINSENDIVIYLKDDNFLLKFDQNIWEQIKKHING